MLMCHFSKVASNFIEVSLRHGCSPANLLHIFRTPFLKSNLEWLLLKLVQSIFATNQKQFIIANSLMSIHEYLQS